ncbi:MAG TPA: hypothetical protein VGH33_27990 [Isosphaeraceae bacterium]
MRIGVGLSRAVALAALVALPAAPTRAQFGFGGFGFGFNSPGTIYGAQTTGMLNSWALQNGAKATMGPVQDNVYANNPNAYINHLHDEGYLDKYDVGTRREIEASVGRYSDGPPPSYYRTVSQRPAPAAQPAPAQPTAPVVPLSSFFDRYQKLVWPAGSPEFGDLAAKRTTANQSCLAVLNDYNLRGLAQVGTVTEARSNLVEYGRPALQYIRDNSTPRVADTFHLFLLSLYESLAQAATIPKSPSPSPSPTPVSAPPATPAAVPAAAPRP